jgi:AraC-like DNA-binding protein
MISNERYFNFRLGLKNIAFLRFVNDSEYHDIVSPYSRIYLITEGNGHLLTGNQNIILEPGFMYHIPSFVHSSYAFKKNLAHIYIHFEASMENGLTVYNLFSFQNKIPATELNTMLFNRLLKLNPGLELPHHDPHVYQTKPWMDKKPTWNSASQKLETEAIIQQLLACFISDVQGIDLISNLKYNIAEILSFIQENLHTDIKIEQLAEIACLSKDHFTRVFKSVFGVPPCEFIIRKRIEKSQFLLLTSDLPVTQIVDETNFKNAPYFSRMFKKYTLLTPGEYRKNRFSGI